VSADGVFADLAFFSTLGKFKFSTDNVGQGTNIYFENWTDGDQFLKFNRIGSGDWRMYVKQAGAWVLK
jgi:hypothetical protein